MVLKPYTTYTIFRQLMLSSGTNINESGNSTVALTNMYINIYCTNKNDIRFFFASGYFVFLQTV